MPTRLFPAAVFRAIIDRYHTNGAHRTRLFNQSINEKIPCRTRHMSAWAAEIDHLSAMYDILVIQSAGNLGCTSPAPWCGIREHLIAGRDYPDYLLEPSCRVANPGQSLQTLTVGSVAYMAFSGGDWESLARDRGHPSAFSRSGFGIWDAIKPEVVDFGRDNLRSAGDSPRVATPSVGRECFPELVRSTLHPPGPAADRDDVGISFAAPKVAHISAKVQSALPDQPCLLYRALIVQSARWPQWAQDKLLDLNSLPTKGRQSDAARQERLQAEVTGVLRHIGYGVPDLERATTNTDFRATYISEGAAKIKAGECHLYEVPVPASLRRPGDEFEILIEVTLSYSARPRRTRRHPRRYLSTWLEWKSNRHKEPLPVFQSRAIKVGEPSGDEMDSFGWAIGMQPGHGIIKNAKRGGGTVQKDWAVKESNALPESFCIAVVGHKGWDQDPDATASYALAVSFESRGQKIKIYGPLRVALQELRTAIEVEAEAEVEVAE